MDSEVEVDNTPNHYKNNIPIPREAEVDEEGHCSDYGYQSDEIIESEIRKIYKSSTHEKPNISNNLGSEPSAWPTKSYRNSSEAFVQLKETGKDRNIYYNRFP